VADLVWTDVTSAIAPELTTLTPEQEAAILGYVNEAFLNVSAFGTAQLRLARLTLAAHLGTLAKRRGSGVAGPLVSESMGGVARSYAADMTASAYASTSYGTILSGLLRASGARLPIVLGVCR